MKKILRSENTQKIREIVLFYFTSFLMKQNFVKLFCLISPSFFDLDFFFNFLDHCVPNTYPVTQVQIFFSQLRLNLYVWEALL